MESAKFFGSDLSPADSAPKLELINVKYMTNEDEAISNRWFDYRNSDSIVNTYRMASVYREIYRRNQEIAFDVKNTTGEFGFKGTDIMLNSKARTGIWKARQQADLMSIPYEFYINGVFDYTKNNYWKRLPNANQLSGEKMITYIGNKFKKQLQIAPPMPVNNHYLSFNFRPDKDQMEFQLYLAEVLGYSKNMISAMSHHLLDSQLLHPKTAEMAFGQKALNDAIRFWKNQQ